MKNRETLSKNTRSNRGKTGFVILIVIVFLVAGTTFTYVNWQNSQTETQTKENQTPLPDDGLEVPFVVTPNDVVQKMLELCKPQKGELLYDLGCGDGRIVIAAAKQYGCRGIGFDIQEENIKKCWENAKAAGVEDLVDFRVQDIFADEMSYKDADIVTLYLYPELNLRLLPKLQQMSDGKRVVSHRWIMAGVKEDEYIEMPTNESNDTHYIYFWNTPMLVEADFVPEPNSVIEDEFVKIKDVLKYKLGPATP